MNFTREPIIETVITPREGSKLLVRNSKGGGLEEYYVDALEVVSFGHSFFFRTLERPKAFLVPVGDYEVVEVKETRVALKNAPMERAIKIGGGREGHKPHREPAPEKHHEPAVVAEEEGATAEQHSQPSQEQRNDKKRGDRRRRHRRRGSDERQDWSDKERRPEDRPQKEQVEPAREGAVEGGGAGDETIVSSSMFSRLFPPPPTLISETIGRYKDYKDNPIPEGTIFPKEVETTQEEPEARHKHEKSNNEDAEEGTEE